MEAAKREQLALRQRDRSAELGAQIEPRLAERRNYSPRSVAHTDPWRGIRLPHAALGTIQADDRVGQIDGIEMATARMLLSTNLGIYRHRMS